MNSNFDTLRAWAEAAQERLGARAEVRVQEPKFANGGLIVELELQRTVAQIMLWPSDMLDLIVLSTASPETVANEHHEVLDSDGLARILDHMERLLRSSERRTADVDP